MVTQALPTNRIVRVNASITPSAPLRPDFGRGLLITTQGDTLRPPDNRTITVADVKSVGDIVPTTSSLYKKAQEWFGQTPYPKDLIIGRWAETAQNAEIIGGTHSTLAALQALTAAPFTINEQDSANVDLSGVANLAAVATSVETAMQAITNPTAWATATAYAVGDFVSGSDENIYRALIAQTTASDNDPVDDTGVNWMLLGPQVNNAAVAYDNGAFTITNDNQLLMTLPTGTIAAGMGLTSAQSARSFAGYDADDNITDAFNAMVDADGTFYWVGHDSMIADYTDGGVLQQLAAAVQSSGRYQLDLNSYGTDQLVTGETASFDARIGALAQNRVNRNYNGTFGQSIGVGIAAVMSSVNFNGVRTLVNPHGRALRGFTPAPLTIAQANELERKRVNYFATIGPQSIYTEGTTGADGVWRDSQYFLDWLQEQVQLDVYNYIVNTPTRTPQTAEGLQGVLNVIRTVCRQGVRNGGIAPGFVSEALRGTIRAVTGVPEFDGFLERGFLVYAPAFSTLTDSQLRERQAPNPRVWIRGSGAINNIEIDMVYDG